MRSTIVAACLTALPGCLVTEEGFAKRNATVDAELVSIRTAVDDNVATTANARKAMEKRLTAFEGEFDALKTQWKAVSDEFVKVQKKLALAETAAANAAAKATTNAANLIELDKALKLRLVAVETEAKASTDKLGTIEKTTIPDLDGRITDNKDQVVIKDKEQKKALKAETTAMKLDITQHKKVVTDKLAGLAKFEEKLAANTTKVEKYEKTIEETKNRLDKQRQNIRETNGRVMATDESLVSILSDFITRIKDEKARIEVERDKVIKRINGQRKAEEKEKDAAATQPSNGGSNKANGEKASNSPAADASGPADAPKLPD